MKISGTNQESNQAYNRALVLRMMQHSRRCSRVELARRTGLKQATISHIINEFIEMGLVEETGAFSGSKGRRAISICFSDKRYRVIAFRLTRQHYSIGVFTLAGDEVGERITRNIENSDPEYIIHYVCDAINDILKTQCDYTFLAVGVAVPGPYYEDSGEIAMISTFQGWWNIRIREIMQAQIDVPVIVEHDANAGALAESTLVERRDVHDTLVYVSAGQGIGAGIINRGELYKGALGIAGEIGHTCVDIHGAVCDCGRRGCLTMYASTIALAQDVSARLGRDVTFAEAVALLKAGRPEAVEAFQRLMRYLGAGIINLVYTYNPSCIVIGDEISSIGQPILDALNRQLREMNVTRLASQVRIELADLGFDSAYAGAAIVASRYVFDNLAMLAERRSPA